MSVFDYGLDDESSALSPQFAAAHRAMVAAATDPAHLDVLTQHLIGLAVSAAVTHLDRDAMRQHIAAARDAGASERQLIEVLQLASVLGMHTIVIGAPALAAHAPEAFEGELTARQARIKAEMLERRGYWPEVFEPLLRLDPDFFEASAQFQDLAYEGEIDAKTRELIFTAIDTSTTHMYANAQRHIELALAFGASPREVMATLELTSLIGVKSYVAGIAALGEQVPG
ncbi:MULTISPECIES: carboxymuconolactone decarboxylase family protein [unclassified Microbacterium]|uniref:carboxymuconolactone decarboxylase family protein n=1 Tax=unclassified Microbacterium TaxID=2609290 RepID=UPI000C2C26D3|nr:MULTISPECIES: carboxymuconolactone decarboxylase family protein [unclassified Microbacterium]